MDPREAMRVYDVFMFTLKAVCQGLSLAPSSAEYMKVWDVVNAVAQGKLTLNVSPAEVSHPDMTQAMKDQIASNHQAKVRREQELAAMIVRAADGFTSAQATA